MIGSEGRLALMRARCFWGAAWLVHGRAGRSEETPVQHASVGVVPINTGDGGAALRERMETEASRA